MGDPVSSYQGKAEANSGAIAHVTRWNVEETADNKTYVSSSTSGWAETVEGAKRWVGTLDLLLDAGAFLSAPLVPGTKLTKLELFVNDANSRFGAARIDSVSGPEVDIDGSGLVGCTVAVTGHGALT